MSLLQNIFNSFLKTKTFFLYKENAFSYKISNVKIPAFSYKNEYLKTDKSKLYPSIGKNELNDKNIDEGITKYFYDSYFALNNGEQKQNVKKGKGKTTYITRNESICHNLFSNINKIVEIIENKSLAEKSEDINEDKDIA